LDDSDRAKYLFLSLLQVSVGSSLVSRLGSIDPEVLFETTFADLAEWSRVSAKAARAFDGLQRSFDARALEDRLAVRGIRALTLADDEYPALLRSIPDPPPALYVHGRVPETVSVALVGSRKASATGLETARTLGRALSERGVCVVSGLALGVHAAAHEGAVDGGGPTVGVLGCGIDVTYPTKYKRFRVALPRQALRGLHAPIRTNEGLGASLLPRARWKALRRQRRVPGGDCGERSDLAGTSVPHVSVPPNLRGARIRLRGCAHCVMLDR